MKQYAPCPSQASPENEFPENAFNDRVMKYIESRLESGHYDFYISFRNQERKRSDGNSGDLGWRCWDAGVLNVLLSVA